MWKALVVYFLVWFSIAEVCLASTESSSPKKTAKKSSGDNRKSSSASRRQERQPSSTVSGRQNNKKYGVKCTEAELLHLETVQIMNMSSNCPRRDSWLQVVLSDSVKRLSSNVMTVGCNKGDDFIAMMGAYSGNKRYNVKTWLKNLYTLHKTARFACGVAKQIPSPVLRIRPVQGYCLEPMAKNLRMLKKLSDLMNLDPKTVHIEGEILLHTLLNSILSSPYHLYTTYHPHLSNDTFHSY